LKYGLKYTVKIMI